MHIPVIVMLVISVVFLISLFVLDWQISHGGDSTETKEHSDQHPNKK